MGRYPVNYMFKLGNSVLFVIGDQDLAETAADSLHRLGIMASMTIIQPQQRFYVWKEVAADELMKILHQLAEILGD
jgi:hypothetical protein